MARKGDEVLTEASRVLSELAGFSVEVVERLNAGGLDLVVVDLGLVRGARTLLVVMPPRTTINLWASRRAVAAALHVAGEARHKLAIILYSRGGRLTKPAYLYLGAVGSRLDSEIAIVNGPPSEVAHVLASLRALGRFVIGDNRVYPAKID